MRAFQLHAHSNGAKPTNRQRADASIEGQVRGGMQAIASRLTTRLQQTNGRRALAQRLDQLDAEV